MQTHHDKPRRSPWFSEPIRRLAIIKSCGFQTRKHLGKGLLGAKAGEENNSLIMDSQNEGAVMDRSENPCLLCPVSILEAAT